MPLSRQSQCAYRVGSLHPRPWVTAQRAPVPSSAGSGAQGTVWSLDDYYHLALVLIHLVYLFSSHPGAVEPQLGH